MTTKETILETRCLSSLSKVFADEDLRDSSYSRGSALLNETFSFQVAYRSGKMIKPLRVQVHSALKDFIAVRKVGLVPSELPCYEDCDDNVLRATPGLYPDPLYPLDGDGLAALPGQWRSIWVTVTPDGHVQPGRYPIDIIFATDAGEEIGRAAFELEWIGERLPEQSLIHTEWFHTDCLATHYGVEVFSEEHWRIIDRYIDTAVRHGINMILTPLFTPPLDTAIGGERPTVQLVDIVKKDELYEFRFDKLQRWVELCNRRGVKYFEFSHFYTQWGAKHAPKIVAEVNGDLRSIFGWETDARGHEYQSFLSQFLPVLVRFLRKYGLEQRSYFHISDEPHTEHLEQYRANSAFIRQYLEEFPIIDALSDYSFYELGVVKNPIPSNDHIEPFVANRVKPLWTYYCVSQRNKVSNRFYNMPSARNRILGIQLYKFDVDGFLHWGYNFWYSQYSRKRIDPFKVTDAGLAFASGDAYLVYPGEDGPIESIRMEVLFEALQDLRALRLLESRIGKEGVMAIIEEGLDEPITFSEYPHGAEWLLRLRERINGEIKKHA